MDPGRPKEDSAFALLEMLETRRMLSGEPWGWAPHMIGLDTATQQYPSIDGRGESIAIIDCGVNYNHPVLGGGFGAGHKVIAGYDFADNDSDVVNWGNPHGTGSAAAAAASPYIADGKRWQGVASGANIIALRNNSSWSTKQCLDWIIANRTKYNIVSTEVMDWGGANWSVYSSELKTLHDAGVFLVAPTGNGGPGASAQGGPAYTRNIFQAGSVNSSGQVSYFTQRGSGLDLLSPGQQTMVAWFSGSNYFECYGDGTSWSAPAVAGAAALVKQINPKFSADQVLAILRDSGTGVYDSYSNTTYPMLNVAGAISLAYQRSSQASNNTPASAPLPVSPSAPTSQSSPTKSAKSTPFSTVAVNGETIAAANFDNGGEDVAYHDMDSGNIGGAYRKTGVDLFKNSKRRGAFVGLTTAGEWIDYSIKLTRGKSYNIKTQVASAYAGARFHYELDGQAITRQMTVPATGGWEKWVQLSLKTTRLTAGNHVLRLVFDANSSCGAGPNVLSIKVV